MMEDRQEHMLVTHNPSGAAVQKESLRAERTWLEVQIHSGKVRVQIFDWVRGLWRCG